MAGYLQPGISKTSFVGPRHIFPVPFEGRLVIDIVFFGFKVQPLTADTSVSTSVPGMTSHQWFRLLPDRMQDVVAVYCRLALSGGYLFYLYRGLTVSICAAYGGHGLGEGDPVTLQG